VSTGIVVAVLFMQPVPVARFVLRGSSDYESERWDDAYIFLIDWLYNVVYLSVCVLTAFDKRYHDDKDIR